MWNKSKIEQLNKYRELIQQAGGPERVAKQYGKGKMTARERLLYLFDEGTFEEVGSLIESRFTDFGMDQKKLPGDGVITGFGLINRRLTFAAAEDFTVIGGTYGEKHSEKICHIMDMAYEMQAPIICLNDSGGARIEEGIAGLHGYGQMFRNITRASGKIPQIAVMMGPSAGGSCYGPALCDYVFMVEKTSQMFITGPVVVKTVIGEEISAENLGGASAHMKKSGVVHFSYPDDKSCLDGVKKLLSYLPQNYHEPIPRVAGRSVDLSYSLQDIVPDNPKKSYDIHMVIRTLVDEDSFFEVQKEFGKSLVVGFARMDSEALGIIASQTCHCSGALDIDSSEKAARFIRFCDCFGIPLLTMIDVTGFMPGSKQEHGGIIRRGAKLLYAYCEASVPKISLILRKAYGGAYIAMNSKGMGADIVYAWPIAEIAVMGAEGAADIIFKKELRAATEQDRKELRQKRIREYNDKFMSPYIAAKLGIIDEVICPEETRMKLCSALDMLKRKSRNKGCHGNIPL